MKFFSHFSHSFLAFAAAAALITGCKEEEAPVAPVDEDEVIVISGIDPVSGPVGTVVTVTGENFDAAAEDHIFYFNGGRQAPITAITDTEIMVTVPEGATSGRTTLTTKGLTITGPEFTVTVPETSVTAVQPNQVTDGMRVKILGTHFGNELTDHVVLFNGAEGTISYVTDNEITVTVPENVSSGIVSLKLDGKTYEGPAFTILEGEDVNLGEGFNTNAGISAIGEAFVYEDGGIDGSTALRLTPAKADRVGLAYYGKRVAVENGFETTFDFRISRPGRPEGQTGEQGAEGLAFVIHNDPDGLAARGHRGGSLGYAGIRNGLAVEFDIYQNLENEHPMGDPNGNHISVHSAPKGEFGEIGAEINYSLGYTTDETNPDLPNFIGNESSSHTAKIVYEPGLLKIFLDDMTTPVLELPITLSEYMQFVDGKAFVGFTAATGVDWGWASHDILNWTLAPAETSGQ